MSEELELVNGHFVMKEKEEEVKPSETKNIPRQYSEEVITLRDRVIKGNQKLFEAWLIIRELAPNTEERSRQMDRWNESQNKLHYLCSELKMKRYDDCLYIVNGKKTKHCLKNQDGFWCQVCPSTYRYWEKEFSDL